MAKSDTTVSDCLKTHFKLNDERIALLLSLGSIYLKDRRVYQDSSLKAGDHLRFYPMPRRFSVDGIDWKSILVKETDDYIIVNKPGGIPTIATTDNGLENILEQMRRATTLDLLVTSRLDTPTSGLLVFAKTKAFQTRFNDWLRDGKIEKYYEAVTEKAVSIGLLTHYMAPGEDLPKRLTKEPRKGWLSCKLEVRSCEPFEAHGVRYFKISLRLLTGRTHQIRAQLAFEGAPIVGDREYGFKGKAPIVEKKEIALRAVRLKFENEEISNS